MSLTNSRQFFFLKVVADVTSACRDSEDGDSFCIDEDVNTESVTVVSLGSIPEQKNPTEEGGGGWGGFYGYPSGEYTVYLPLVCLNFNDSLPVSWVGDNASSSEYRDKNPMWSHLIYNTELGGISGLLMLSSGQPYVAGGITRGGDPAALWVDGVFADYLDPEDSRYVLSSL
jgi:hypothetical protein